MVHIILVHIGDTFPTYLRDCIEQIQHVCKIPIHVLASKSVLDKLDYNIVKADLSTIPTSEHDTRFKNTTTLQKGFWQHATQRFFVLHNYMKQKNLNDVFHMEYDNLLYYDVSKLLDVFRTKDMWVIIDAPTRCIPGFMYIKSAKQLNDMLPTVLAGAAKGQNDMVTLAAYANKTTTVGHLPIVKLTPEFGVLFDGAAVGQYIGGVDPRNDPKNTIGFINETTTFKCDDQTIEWRQHVPYMNNLPLVNLHIHSKDLQRWRSQPHFISGEIIQETCEVYLGLEDDFSYNPRISIQTQKHKNLEAITGPWDNPQRIFCYSHRLPIFQGIQQFMKNPYILVTHNSDENITDKYIQVAQDKKLTHWYAQNLLIAHPKASMLPIGIANSMWPHGNLSALGQAVHSIKQKTQLVYFFFDFATNDSERISCMVKLITNGFMFGTKKPYSKYIEDLAKHDYAICPSGNGKDSHRIWECLYLNVCPVMLKDTFSLALSKRFPIILVNDWSSLYPINLPKRELLIPMPSLEQFYHTNDKQYSRS